MRAKERKASESTSSFSKREKMRRKPLRLRKRRSISLRFLYSARSKSQGCSRLDLHHRNHTQIEHQLLGLIPFSSAIHQERKALRHGT